MTFNSLTFALFLLVALSVDRALSSSNHRKSFLLAMSALFYAAWNPPFVLLVAFSTVLDFMAMQKIAAATHRAARNAWLAVSVTANLGLLAFFKYGTFVVENTEHLLRSLGVPLTFAAPSIVLPVGISFYTFQTLSTTIDVHRGRLAPCTSLRDYALFVTFFPQLVAGPIVRGADFLPQLKDVARATRREVHIGLALVVVGIFMKVVLADGVFAPVVDPVFDIDAHSGAAAAWAAVAAFSGQIYCDFAGYSLVAIGVALSLGFTLPDNFRAPYAARGFSDFWRRWHITLSSWLRDYLYIPLGGNRHGSVRTTMALAGTMLLGGLWHGASWTFVFWGALHGAFLIVERWIERGLWRTAPMVRWRERATSTTTAALGVVVSMTTLLGVMIAWVPFRAKTFTHAKTVLSSMFALSSRSSSTAWSTAGATPSSDAPAVLAVATFAGLVLAHHLFRGRRIDDVIARAPGIVVALLLAGAGLLIVLSTGEDRAFLYFQF